MAKTKTYTFTDIEVLALRDACIEYYQEHVKNKPPSISPVVQEVRKAIVVLKDQFKDDYRIGFWLEK